VLVEREGLHPGEEVGGQRHDLDSDPVLVIVVEGPVPQSGVLQGGDAVPAAGTSPVPSLERGEGPT